MAFKQRDPNKPEKVLQSDPSLSAEEACAVITALERWPAGLGEVLVPCDSARGWKRDPDFHIFAATYVPPKDALLCPVMEVKRVRGQSNDYGLHLIAWRSLRDAYSTVLGVTPKVAHQLYNEHLRLDPSQMRDIYQRYLSLKLTFDHSLMLGHLDEP